MKALLLNFLMWVNAGAVQNFVLPAPDPSMPVPWDSVALETAPQTFPAPDELVSDDPEIRALFYQGEMYHGEETRVFAWVGIPSDHTVPVPSMVLVHGATGTAFKEWVRLWVDRGYAAIALDTSGHIPVRSPDNPKKWSTHEYSGPGGWGGFKHVNDPVEEQWPYHAVSAVIRAHSLLRSFPEVDSSRIGLTGISWGGFLTCVTAGVDSRFRFAAPVYGCGFLGEDSSWLYTTFQPMGETDALRWLSLWDPSRYVCRITMPMLFVNGTNDKHYRMDSWQKTYRLAQGDVHLCCKVNMAHNHPAGWGTEEIYAFADSILKDEEPLAEITGQGHTADTARVTFSGSVSVIDAVLNYTADDGKWPDRQWQTVPAEFNSSTGKAEAALPENTTAYYFNLTDSRGFVSSSPHENIQ